MGAAVLVIVAVAATMIYKLVRRFLPKTQLALLSSRAGLVTDTGYSINP